VQSKIKNGVSSEFQDFWFNHLKPLFPKIYCENCKTVPREPQQQLIEVETSLVKQQEAVVQPV
jgi:hypothetical protein